MYVLPHTHKKKDKCKINVWLITGGKGVNSVTSLTCPSLSVATNALPHHWIAQVLMIWPHLSPKSLPETCHLSSKFQPWAPPCGYLNTVLSCLRTLYMLCLLHGSFSSHSGHPLHNPANYILLICQVSNYNRFCSFFNMQHRYHFFQEVFLDLFLLPYPNWRLCRSPAYSHSNLIILVY